MWTKLSPELPDKPVVVPFYLRDYAMSFAYVDDVARLLVDVILDDGVRAKATNDVFNIAMDQTVTGEQLLRDIARQLQVIVSFTIISIGLIMFFFLLVLMLRF